MSETVLSSTPFYKTQPSIKRSYGTDKVNKEKRFAIIFFLNFSLSYIWIFGVIHFEYFKVRHSSYVKIQGQFNYTSKLHQYSRVFQCGHRYCECFVCNSIGGMKGTDLVKH